MNIRTENKLDFDDVLLVPKRTKTASRAKVRITRDFRFYHSCRTWQGTPIMASNMDATGTIAMAKTLQGQSMITCLHKHYDRELLVDSFYGLLVNNTWLTIGINSLPNRDINMIERVKDRTGRIPNICVDVANGYTDQFVSYCAKIREYALQVNEDPIIMAGNVCTPEMVQELILHGGVDIVKVGIGPGSACTTRLKTGVGYPQLSAISECSHAAHGLKSDEGRLGLVCADGGCRTPGDVCKAFAANADFVMLGGMLAGTDECEGEWEYHDPPSPFTYVDSDGEKKKKTLKFYGMSSKKAQEKHNGGLAEYKSSEGRVKSVPYRGPANEVIKDILGGIRSCCSYIGATSIKDMSKCAEFIRVGRTHYDQTT